MISAEKSDIGITKELLQMHLKNAFQLCHKNELSSDERKKNLNAIMLLKEKTNEETKEEEVKARIVADGRNQRADADPLDTASPTIKNESVLITDVIDAKEGRDVSTLDLPGAYLWAEQDQVLHMVLKGELAELMVLAAPELYSPFI